MSEGEAWCWRSAVLTSEEKAVDGVKKHVFPTPRRSWTFSKEKKDALLIRSLVFPPPALLLQARGSGVVLRPREHHARGVS